MLYETCSGHICNFTIYCVQGHILGRLKTIKKPTYIVEYKYMKDVDRANQYLSYYSILLKEIFERRLAPLREGASSVGFLPTKTFTVACLLRNGRTSVFSMGGYGDTAPKHHNEESSPEREMQEVGVGKTQPTALSYAQAIAKRAQMQRPSGPAEFKKNSLSQKENFEVVLIKPKGEDERNNEQIKEEILKGLEKAATVPSVTCSPLLRLHGEMSRHPGFPGIASSFEPEIARPCPVRDQFVYLVLANGEGRTTTLCQRSYGLPTLPGAMLHSKKKPRINDCTSVHRPATSRGYSVDVQLDKNCKSCPSCFIDLSTRTLPQHIRSCNQPPPSDDGTFKYHSCTNTYKAYAGILNDRTVGYNENDIELKISRSKTAKIKWTASEERQLFRLELSLSSGLI
ncbi:hypothetical protein WN51_06538 [Melipona quadrifasciata]|uniref:Uncharacterized protein n=1 Tax=Melipona quadrifasciata TaxID=166423 RepID=A0A0N0U3K7_9HYME|nr:hypothetical protein WN51_06538 [Melipona quadrifasciata]